MKTIGAAIDECILELGFKPSDFDEPTRRLMVERVHEFENDVLTKVMNGKSEFRLVLEPAVREHRLPSEVFSIDTLSINDSDITKLRVSPSQITVR